MIIMDSIFPIEKSRSFMSNNCMQLIKSFMKEFYGYGNYLGDYWFIGMEEGGGNDCNDINKRLCAWDTLGQPELADLYQFHYLIGITHFFQPPVKLQTTWSKLIRLLLSAQGKFPISQDIRDYQIRLLGRIDGETCLLELLPLPSPSTNQWIYAKCFDLPKLKSREEYKNYCLPYRISHLRQRISHHKPKLVVFYGFNYLKHWQAIANVPLIHYPSLSPPIYIGCNNDTLFIVIKHPVARGVPNTYFEQVGKIARKLLKNGYPNDNELSDLIKQLKSQISSSSV